MHREILGFIRQGLRVHPPPERSALGRNTRPGGGLHALRNDVGGVIGQVFGPNGPQGVAALFGPNGAAGCSHEWSAARRQAGAAQLVEREIVRNRPGGAEESSKKLLRPAGAKEDKKKRIEYIRFPPLR